mgnify:CR=1 FL=1
MSTRVTAGLAKRDPRAPNQGLLVDSIWYFSFDSIPASSLASIDLEALDCDDFFIGQVLLSTIWRCDPWGLARMYNKPTPINWRLSYLAFSFGTVPFLHKDDKLSTNGVAGEQTFVTPLFGCSFDLIPGFSSAVETWAFRSGASAADFRTRKFSVMSALALVAHPLFSNALLLEAKSVADLSSHIGGLYCEMMGVLHKSVYTGVFNDGKLLDTFLDTVGRLLSGCNRVGKLHLRHNNLSDATGDASPLRPNVGSVHQSLRFVPGLLCAGSAAEKDRTDEAILVGLPLDFFPANTREMSDMCFILRLRLWYRLRFVPCRSAREIVVLSRLHASLMRNDAELTHARLHSGDALSGTKSATDTESMAQELVSKLTSYLVSSGARDIYLLLDTVQGALWAMGATQSDLPARDVWWFRELFRALSYDLGITFPQQTLRELCEYAASEAVPVFEHTVSEVFRVSTEMTLATRDTAGDELDPTRDTNVMEIEMNPSMMKAFSIALMWLHS